MRILTLRKQIKRALNYPHFPVLTSIQIMKTANDGKKFKRKLGDVVKALNIMWKEKEIFKAGHDPVKNVYLWMNRDRENECLFFKWNNTKKAVEEKNKYSTERYSLGRCNVLSKIIDFNVCNKDCDFYQRREPDPSSDIKTATCYFCAEEFLTTSNKERYICNDCGRKHYNYNTTRKKDRYRSNN